MRLRNTFDEEIKMALVWEFPTAENFDFLVETDSLVAEVREEGHAI